MTVQVQFDGGHLVDLRDHPGPVQLDQGPDQRPQPQEFIAGAGKQPDGRAPRAVAVQPCQREGLSRSPAEFIQEREDDVTGADRLQPGQRLLRDRDLDLIQHRLIGPGQPLASQVPRGCPGGDGRTAERTDRRNDGRPGQDNLPQLHRSAGARHQVGDHLRPVQHRDLLGDVPGIQQLRRPPASIA